MASAVGVIKSTIMNMERPFKLSDLFDQLDKVGITNKLLIIRVLDELLAEDLVLYEDISHEDIVYSSLLFHQSITVAK